MFCTSSKYIFCVLSFLGFVNIYAMRVNLSVAIVSMTADTNENWNESTKSLILGSFFYGYILTQIPAGRLSEIIGGKWIFGFSVFFTAALTFLTPWAAKQDYKVLIGLRIIEGLMEGGTFPSMNVMIAGWTNSMDRSRISAFIYSGTCIGTLLSLPLTGYICDTFGWPMSFYCFGSFGMFWFLFWIILGAENPSNDLVKNPKIPWKSILSSKPFYAILLANIAHGWGFNTLLSELPTYLDKILHFNIKEVFRY